MIDDPPNEPYEQARPIWADVDLDAITHNLALMRERAGRPVRIIAAIKANAYGHGVETVASHLEACGVDGLATANLDDALKVRRAGVTIPIVMYGSALPGGLKLLVESDLTPSVWTPAALAAVARIAAESGRTIAVHVKVDSGLGRIGVRLDEAAAFLRDVVATPGVLLEGIYTHLPFSGEQGAEWSKRRLAEYTAVIRAVEQEHGIAVEYSEAAASSILSEAFPDTLTTISPGHLLYGLSPLTGGNPESLGFRKAVTALRGRLIHVGQRRRGDDLIRSGPGGAIADSVAGVVLLGMDNGYRAAASGDAFMLCHGTRCPVLSVSAEYTVIDITGVPAAAVGDVVTIIGEDGGDAITVESLAEQVGVPSAAYWMMGLSGVPLRYRTSRKPTE